MQTRKLVIVIAATVLLTLVAYSIYRLFPHRASSAASPGFSTPDATAQFLDCIPISDAPAHVNARGCVTGQVLKVFTSRADNTFFDFCADYRNCPFSAVVFAEDKPRFYDLTQFSGHEVEIRGQITLYRNRAEIIVHDPSQIRLKL